jgi:MoaA/NifB/PqqE/SkfB family radical SAM enzyme
MEGKMIKLNQIKEMFHIMDSITPNMKKAFKAIITENRKNIFKYVNIAKRYKESCLIREKLKNEENIIVPPIMILSITSKCNLKCKGCFAYNTGVIDNGKNLLFNDWKKVIEEAIEIGVFGFLMIGGETFLYENLLELCDMYKDNLFVIFTNGTLLDKEKINKLKNMSNTVVVISIEGDNELTDNRRGEKTYNKALKAFSYLKENKIMSGVSITITTINYKFWMDEKNLDYLIDNGIRLGFFTEYIPLNKKEQEEFCLDNHQRKIFREKILEYKKNKNMLIIHSPGDEEALGGCVSSGIGFAHINPFGNVTPCPVSDVFTHNIKDYTLKECLNSQLFKDIRNNKKLLENNDSSCSLYSNKEELNKILSKNNI